MTRSSKRERSHRRKFRRDLGYSLEPVAVTCPYCGQPAEAAVGTTVYPRRPELSGLHFYVCWRCDARVGTHKGTWQPMGPLADRELRRLRHAAHEAFDPIWRHRMLPSGPAAASVRHEAYGWLAGQLNLPAEQCHIGRLTREQCREVIRISEGFRASRANS
jgi:hypothetical protein